MTYGGSATSVAAGLTLNDIGVIVGIAAAFIGIAIQAYYGGRRDCRDQKLFELERDKLKGEQDD